MLAWLSSLLCGGLLCAAPTLLGHEGPTRLLDPWFGLTFTALALVGLRFRRFAAGMALLLALGLGAVALVLQSRPEARLVELASAAVLAFSALYVALRPLGERWSAERA